MRIDVLTLFPEMIGNVAQFGIPRRAIEAQKLQVQARDIRNYATRADRRVDDRPYGGGPGMVMQAEPMARALDAAQAELPRARTVFMSPQGETLNQAWLQRLAAEPELILVCGRYEGLDERIAGRFDIELSLGDYVLSGGELAAMVIIDGIARLLPGVLGDENSAVCDSFTAGLLDHPHYSRPEDWRGAGVPEILLSGDHARVARWRMQQALGRTWLRRPELLDNLQLTAEQARLLREFIAESGEERRT